MSSFCLPCGLTVQQLLDGLAELVVVGGTVMSQPEISAMGPLLTAAGAYIAKQQATYLTQVVDTEQSDVTKLEDARLATVASMVPDRR